jgi:hypothetical protein
MAPVLKALIATKAAGFVTLGEAKYGSEECTVTEALVEHFFVGRPLGAALRAEIDVARPLLWAAKVLDMAAGHPLGHLMLSGPGIIHHERGPRYLPELLTPAWTPAAGAGPPPSGPFAEPGDPLTTDPELEVTRECLRFVLSDLGLLRTPSYSCDAAVLYPLSFSHQGGGLVCLDVCRFTSSPHHVRGK